MIIKCKFNFLVLCLLVSNLFLSSNYHILSAQKINSNPFIVESDPLNCNFRLTFHHLDSSDVYNCSVLGTDQFCCKNDEFLISISHCGKLLSPLTANGVFLKRDCDIFFLNGNLIDSKGYQYDGIMYCSRDQSKLINPKITYFSYFRYNEKSILVYYHLLNIPEYWSFKQVFKHSMELSESISIKTIELWD